jgi:integrase
VSIYRRGDGRWVGSLDLGRDANGKRKRHVVYGSLRREVVAKLEEARSRLAADEPVKDARVTVAAFVDDWLRKALPASGRRAATVANYSSIARTHIQPAPFGALTLDRLRPSDIEALLTAKRDAGLSQATVQRIYQVVRAALDIAVRDGLARRNAAAALRRPTIKRAEARYLTAGEVSRLLDAAVSDPLLPLLVVMLGTGLRRGEALALHWRDVDLAGGAVRVRWTLGRVDRELRFDEPKTERSRRFVALPAPVIEALRRHKTQQAAERLAAPVWQPWSDHDDLVFPTHVGTPTDPRNGCARLPVSPDAQGSTGRACTRCGIARRRRSLPAELISRLCKSCSDIQPTQSQLTRTRMWLRSSSGRQRSGSERRFRGECAGGYIYGYIRRSRGLR